MIMFFQKAIAVAQKAAQEDQAGNYEEAIRSYKHAVKYFLHILNRESPSQVTHCVRCCSERLRLGASQYKHGCESL